MTSLSFDFQPDVRPLAARLRPVRLEHYIGQQHLLGPGTPLRQAIEAGRVTSLILWGPPGTGKTTLAELIAGHADAFLAKISAVTAGVKEIRDEIAAAKLRLLQYQQRTLLFVDEVHRFNKSQQDAFLPHIEDGTIIFIGATTENPSFSLNNALLSRARVCILKKIAAADLALVLQRALTDTALGLGQQQLSVDEEAKSLLLQLADGDARRLLNLLELAAESVQAEGQQVISKQLLIQLVPRQLPGFDNHGDQFYDLISAFHKSVRGSNPDAALYWYCRILEGGGDPLYVARRLLAIASEDIGNADPRALTIAIDAWDTFSRVGPAEGERAIAQAAVYLALAPKSNAVYTAFNQIRSFVQQSPAFEVPLHLRNAPTKLLKEMGHGSEYRYAHHEPGAYAAGERYLPAEMAQMQFYQPSDRGLEKQLAEKLSYLQQLDLAARNRGKGVTNPLLNYLAIAIGGAIGACLRFALSEWMLHLFGRAFPFGTLLVNILGSFVIGLLYGLLITEQIAPNPWRIFVGIGVLGAFTTFSTFSMDTVLLLQQGDWLKAVVNVVLNVVLCLTLAWLGLKLGSMK